MGILASAGAVPLGVVFAALVLLPVASGLLLLILRNATIRTAIVLPTSWVLTGASLILVAIALTGHGAIDWSPAAFQRAAGTAGAGDASFAISPGPAATIASILILLYVTLLGVLRRSPLIALLGLGQAAALAYDELGGSETPVAAAFKHSFERYTFFHVDWLSVVMVGIVSIIGSIIVVYALPYMKTHEEQHPVARSGQPRFFFVMLLFLGAMNGLAMADDLRWLHLFWEITTLCSFFLIGHDRTEEARQSAYRALWMNMVGGAAFVAALVTLPHVVGGFSVQRLIHAPAYGVHSVALMFGLACLCFAGFTKSAQLPFSGWLLGAMVAPTPVSALLHSSTMVKAGVYLVMRLTPGFQGSLLSDTVVLAGGFTFAVTAMLAIGQTNAKRVLAYSTVSNLGLIIVCAGLNTPFAMTAAILLLIFHAGSKALLFLCTGTVEHHIRSRDIEDMQGLAARMPWTTALMAIGILSMLLPPFGFLIAKVAAIEAAMALPIALVLLVPGSAFTVVFWVKWLGRMLSVQPGERVVPEKLPSTELGPLLLLTGGAIASILCVTPLLTYVVLPAVREWFAAVTADPARVHGFASSPPPSLADLAGVLNVPWMPIIAALTAAVVLPIWLVRVHAERPSSAYLCGEQTLDPVSSFVTVADEHSELSLRSAYFVSWVGEQKHRVWTAAVAVALLVLVFASSWSGR